MRPAGLEAQRESVGHKNKLSFAAAIVTISVEPLPMLPAQESSYPKVLIIFSDREYVYEARDFLSCMTSHKGMFCAGYVAQC